MRGSALISLGSTFVWYLKRPSLYPELVRRLKRIPTRVFESNNNLLKALEESQSWAATRSLPLMKVCERLGMAHDLKRLEDVYPEAWSFAERAEKTCPVRMGGGADADFLFSLTVHVGATRIVETGVAYGWSSLGFLLALEYQNSGHLYSVDRPYPLRNNDKFVGCVVSSAFRSRWTLLRKADREGLPEALEMAGNLDLAHYDSDKSYEGRQFAYPKIWERLRPGGILISDDIGDNMAFRDFATQVGKGPLIFSKSETDYIGLLIK